MNIIKIRNMPLALALLLLILPAIFPPAAQSALSKSSPANEEVWRLNCGAEIFDYTDPSGSWWVKDEPFTGFFRWGFFGGSSSIVNRPISGTNLDVFQTHRWGGTNLAYRIEVPNGLYEVKLHFAETFWTANGRRVFDVAINNVTVLTDHDVFAEAGRDAADTHTFYPTVTQMAIDVTFPRIAADNAMISGIEIKPVQVSDEAFLDFIQKKMFFYFWNEAGPTGIVKDGEKSFAVGGSTFGSIAATGFGLSVLTVGASRGWITPQEARNRIMTTLQTFKNIFRLHGFWYHFININDGLRYGNSEVSTVDSAILIMGALQAGEYFKDTFPEVKALATELYDQMEWDWWLGRGPPSRAPFIRMGWTPEPGDLPNGGPEGGYFIGGWWDQYSESIFVDLLALGSSRFPIAKDAWVGMHREWRALRQYHLIYLPPLFTHQYHNLYYDLRQVHDQAANYWDNSVYSTLQNRDECALDPLGRYEPHRWGLTACSGPGGYTVYGAPPVGTHDGTVAPTAALASMFQTPSVSIPAARYMFFQYKHHIWGRHGFTDAFNVQFDFRSDDALGLDNGPIVLAIENYRTGMVQKTFMQIPSVRAGMAAAGLISYSSAALAQTSSLESDAFPPKYAVDGDTNTRWSSLFSDPQWLSVDFGAPRKINRVKIHWEAAYAKAYRIETSNDGFTWTVRYSTDGAQGGIETIPILPEAEARFVRMSGAERATPYGYSIYEINADFDPPPDSTNLVLNPGFETGGSRWILPAHASIDGHVSHSGSKSARIMRRKIGTNTIRNRNLIRVNPDEPCLFQVWIKLDHVAASHSGGVQAAVRWFDSEGRILRDDSAVSGLTGSLDWTFFQLPARSPAGAAKARLRLRMVNANGQAWFDDAGFFRPAASISGSALENAAALEDSLEDLEEEIQDEDSPDAAPGPDAAFVLRAAFAYPNPSRTGNKPMIHMETGLADSLEIRIYDVAGAQIHSASLSGAAAVIFAGNRYAYEYLWDASNAASGVYLAVLTAKKSGIPDIRTVVKIAYVK